AGRNDRAGGTAHAARTDRRARHRAPRREAHARLRRRGLHRALVPPVARGAGCVLRLGRRAGDRRGGGRTVQGTRDRKVRAQPELAVRRGPRDLRPQRELRARGLARIRQALRPADQGRGSGETARRAMSDPGQLWGGRFEGGLDPAFAEFNRSLAVDRRLWAQDIAGSVAWANALARAGVLTEGERTRIVAALQQIAAELSADPAPLHASPAEDVHSFVEAALTEKV